MVANYLQIYGFVWLADILDAAAHTMVVQEETIMLLIIAKKQGIH